MTNIRSLSDLRKLSKRVGDHFFDPAADESLGTVKILGIYRAPYSALTEGYVITASRDGHAFLYRFETGLDSLKWFPIGRYESLADANAFLAAQGVTV